MGLTLSMPCRPANNARLVSLAGQTFEMTIYACGEGGLTYSLGLLDVADPSHVGPALSALARAAMANLEGRVESDLASGVAGMTPHSQARHRVIVGRLPDGRPVEEHLVLFSHGLRLYQAILMGEKVDVEVARRFIDGLKVTP